MEDDDRARPAWPRGKNMAAQEKKPEKPRRVPFPSASDPKKLMPIRCPLPDHDRASGMPMRFGIGPAQDRELEKKLLENMRLADIDKLVQEAGPDAALVEKELASARCRGGGKLQSRAPDNPGRASGAGGSAGGGDMSLMTAMAGRLRNAEEAASALRDELKKRDATIADLRSRLVRSEGVEFVRRSSSSSPGAHPVGGPSSDADLSMVKDHNAKLRELLRKADAENKRLADENTEIKAFLKDYGMVWVGNGQPPSASSSLTSSAAHSPDSASHSSADADSATGSPEFKLEKGMWQPSVAAGENGDAGVNLNDEAGPAALGCPFDPVRITANVKQLNFVAGEGEKEIAVGPDGMRRFKEKALVAYVFYKNGIFGRGGPLRPYKLPESKVLVKDLMDGYFPWELKDEYPEGVPLRVEFRLAEAWGRNAAGAENVPAFKAFAGAGQALGAAAGGEGGGAGSGGALGDGDREVWKPAAGRSKGDTLFRRLPASVIGSNGDVISVRDDIMDLVRGPKDTEKVHIQKVVPAVGGGVGGNGGSASGGVSSSGAEDDGVKTQEMSTLRIKTPDGGQMLELTLPYDATIGALKEALRAHLARGGGGVKGFSLRTAFPAREYDKEEETLRVAGLIPNALLVMALC